MTARSAAADGRADDARGRPAVWGAFALSVVASTVVWVYVEPVPTLFVSVAISAVPLTVHAARAARVVRWAAFVLLLAFVFLGMASVGVLYVPATVAMCVAAVRGTDPPPAEGA